MIKLLPGLHQFKTEIHAIQEEFFERLAKKQTPQAIFITCSDSRVVPDLLTGTGPGELFVLRNAGNIVPAPSVDVSGEQASIEYAVTQLGVKDIIVCGHSNCGAMKGLLQPESLGEMPAVAKWLRYADQTKKVIDENYKHLSGEPLLSAAVQENVLVQLENLRSVPSVARKLWKREIELHGWVYEIESGHVFVYDPVHEEFLAIGQFNDGFELIPGATLSNSSAGRKINKGDM